MAASPTSSPAPSLSKAEYCLRNAQAAKEAGNAALRADNLRGASFQYKKVYLFLAEYLPEDVTAASRSPAGGSSTNPSNKGESSSSSSGGGGGNDGFVQLLKQRKAAAALSSADAPSATQQQQQEMLQLYATTLNNLALVHLKLGRYKEGVACAAAVLDTPTLRAALESTQPNTSSSSCSGTPVGKALLRRASCYVKLREWAAAEKDVAALVAADAASERGGAQDPACGQLMDAIRLGRKTEAEKEKKMLQRMFA